MNAKQIFEELQRQVYTPLPGEPIELQKVNTVDDEESRRIYKVEHMKFSAKQKGEALIVKCEHEGQTYNSTVRDLVHISIDPFDSLALVRRDINGSHYITAFHNGVARKIEEYSLSHTLPPQVEEVHVQRTLGLDTDLGQLLLSTLIGQENATRKLDPITTIYNIAKEYKLAGTCTFDKHSSPIDRLIFY